MSFAEVNELLLDILKNLAIFPYRFVYQRNTHNPIVAVMDTTSSTDCKAKLEIWFKLKLREAQYVQVAVGPPDSAASFPHSKNSSLNHRMLIQGAILFAATVASLSWSTVSTSHWSGPALWYAAILLSLTSVILGGQQAWLSPLSISTQNADMFKHKFRARRRRALIAWQAPMMCLCYSIVLFLAGLTVVIVSPFASNRTWGEEAKVICIL